MTSMRTSRRGEHRPLDLRQGIDPPGAPESSVTGRTYQPDSSTTAGRTPDATQPTIRRRSRANRSRALLRSRNRDHARANAVEHTIELCRALLSERGEVSGARLAAEVLTAYQRLDEEQVEAFFDRLAEEFSVDPERFGGRPTTIGSTRHRPI